MNKEQPLNTFYKMPGHFTSDNPKKIKGFLRIPYRIKVIKIINK